MNEKEKSCPKMEISTTGKINKNKKKDRNECQKQNESGSSDTSQTLNICRSIQPLYVDMHIRGEVKTTEKDG